MNKEVFVVLVFMLTINSGLAQEASAPSEVSVDPGIVVIYDEYKDYPLTSDFLRVNDTGLERVENMTLENKFGKIVFNETINLTWDVVANVIDLDAGINVSSPRIEINGTSLTSLEKPATFYLYNLTFTNPRLLKNSAACLDCQIVSYSSGLLIFKVNITGFVVYTAEETPGPEPEGPPGGGGGIPSKPPVNITEPCESSWICELWGECEDGRQTRTCTDENNCRAARVEEQTCEEFPFPGISRKRFTFLLWILVLALLVILILLILMIKLREKKKHRGRKKRKK
jgi:hypothetical protein